MFENKCYFCKYNFLKREMKATKTNISRLAATLLLSMAFLTAISCDDSVPGETDVRKKELAAMKYLKSQYMDIYYYWYSKMPIVDPADYNIEDYFDALLWSGDRWSWMMDGSYYGDHSTGVVRGTYGGYLAQGIDYYDDYSVRFAYVYPGSPLHNAGVRRGWELVALGDVDVMDLIKQERFYSEYEKSPQNFTFKSPSGELVEKTLTASTSLITRPGLFYTVFTGADYPELEEPVGYFNYLEFLESRDANGKPMIDDIRDAIAMIKSAGARKMILDLRYNGGGDSGASDTLMYYLAPQSATGKIMCERSHNSKLSRYDSKSVFARLDGSLDLDRLYVIISENSASASEVVINSLRPYMDVQLVGRQSYGKPNGMYVLLYPGDDESYDKVMAGVFDHLEYVFLPICFYSKNANGEYIPDDGFTPDNSRPDDLFHDFGAAEDNIAACLYHVAHGVYPELPSLQKESAESMASGRNGMKNEGAILSEAFRTKQFSPLHGCYLVKNKYF